MSVNKFKPHLIVLPEDDATRELAVGFELCIPGACERYFHIANEVGGWLSVVEKFKHDYIKKMNRNGNIHLLLLIDFDEESERLQRVKSEIPDNLKDRVFILGCWDEPETLRNFLGKSFEEIGVALAKECINNEDQLWNIDLLKNNLSEVDRIRPFIKKHILVG